MASSVGSPESERVGISPVQNRLQYLAMYRFVFASPNWLANAGWALLAMLSQMIIPIVGNLVLVGYFYEMLAGMHRHPDRAYPDFNVNRFSEYLTRGIWPFLVSLIIALPLVAMMAVVYLGIVFAVAFVVETADPTAQAALAILVPLVILLVMTLILVINVVVLPFMLQAGFTRNLSTEGGLCFRRAKQFLRLTWREMVLGMLFLQVSAIPLVILGLLCCYVGVFVPAVWVSFASMHLQYQVYELYLNRGGEPIPFVEDPPRSPPVIPAELA